LKFCLLHSLFILFGWSQIDHKKDLETSRVVERDLPQLNQAKRMPPKDEIRMAHVF